MLIASESFYLLNKAIPQQIQSKMNHIIRAPDEIMGVPGPKMFWLPWRMTQKQISKKTSQEEYDFRKKRSMAPFGPSFVGGLDNDSVMIKDVSWYVFIFPAANICI